jgi:hypothetical protein
MVSSIDSLDVARASEHAKMAVVTRTGGCSVVVLLPVTGTRRTAAQVT